MPRRTEVMPPSKPRESDPCHSHKRDHSTSLGSRPWGTACSNTPGRLRALQVSWPVQHTEERTHGHEPNSGLGRAGGSSQGCLPPAPATRGIPAGHFPQSPPHPTAPGTPSVEVNEDGRQRCPPGPLPRPQLAAQAEPAPVNWIKGRPAGAGRREPHRGCPAAAIGAARARPAPRELLEAGWDPRVPRLK